MPELKFAFQGTVGSFSHQAALLFAKMSLKEFAPESANSQNNYLPYQSFKEVFEQTCATNHCFGVIPLENSSIGSLHTNYDLLWLYTAEIVAEIYLPIHHNLIGLSSSCISNLKEVYSHPAALEQCQQLFKKNPGLKPVIYWDTASSALLVKQAGNVTLAAIASELAAREHNLSILQRNIEDYPQNTTRFVLITKNKEVLSKTRENLTAPYKISCIIELAHKPGTLGQLLNGLSGANLTKIESRPIPENPWHYRFCIDIELTDLAQDDSITLSLNSASKQYKIIGRYQCGERRPDRFSTSAALCS